MPFPILSVLGFIPNLLGYWQKKQEMQLRWFELIFSVIKDLLAFTIAHIRIILIGLILGYCLFIYFKAVNTAKLAIIEKQRAVKALEDKTNADIAEAKKRDAENRLNTILLQKKTDAEIGKYKSALNAIYAKQKGLKNEITINERDIANWRERVRLELESKTIQAARVFEDDTNKLASRDSDATILRPVHEVEAELESCQEAGAIAAADYNLCKSYVDIQQSKLGVSK
jgi:hypothetical protein